MAKLKKRHLFIQSIKGAALDVLHALLDDGPVDVVPVLFNVLSLTVLEQSNKERSIDNYRITLTSKAG